MLHIDLYRARREHAWLAHAIDLEMKAKLPDLARLDKLKKRKLIAKDRIVALEARQARLDRRDPGSLQPQPA